ncbi:MAG: M50 family metallopeptidase [Archangium sp.]
MKKTELHFGRAGLLLAVVVLGSVFWDSAILTPFKLLAVMGHETGHALASLIVGGSVEQVTLRLDESGQCLSRIPDGFFAQVAVYSAGYVGSAVISVLLLVLSFRFNARRAMLAAACAWLGLMGIFYARDAFTLFFSLGMAVAFGAGARWLPVNVVGGVNIFIASFTALYAVMDLKDDLWNSAVRAQSDASLLSELTIVPAIVWAAVWTLVSVVVLIAGAWLALQDNVQKPVTP